MRKAGRQEGMEDIQFAVIRLQPTTVGRQLGSGLNFTEAPRTEVLHCFFRLFVPSSFGMNDRAAFGRERNGFEECAEADDAGNPVGFRRPSVGPTEVGRQECRPHGSVGHTARVGYLRRAAARLAAIGPAGIALILTPPPLESTATALLPAEPVSAPSIRRPSASWRPLGAVP